MKPVRFPLVSIGIPTYNRGDGYLRQALESALAQSYPNLEIVVSDNGSTDNTESVVQSYADPRVRFFRQQPPVVPNDNFNFCLSQANGSYFLLLHDDDKVDPDFVETCLRAASNDTRYGIIRTGVRIINANGMVLNEGRNEVNGLSTGEFFLAWFAGRTSIYLCNTLFNTQALKSIGGLKSRHNLFQDVIAMARLMANHGRLEVEAVKASARWHQAKSTHVARVQAWCEDSLDLLNLLCELAPENADELREKGIRFFANVNYSRASDIRAPGKRLLAYALVYRLFNRHYLPPMRMMFASTSLYRGLRHLKRKLLGLPAWVE
jgi:glycosyltransferase involved in cell wall biosynthesis